MTEKKPTLEYEPPAEEGKTPLRIYLVAALSALIVFLAALVIATVLFDRAFGLAPVRWMGVLIVGESVVPGGLAFYTFQSIVRHPWPRRSFTPLPKETETSHRISD